MATFVPTSALISVDLPTLGAPIRATNPQRVCACSPCAGALSPVPACPEEAQARRPALVLAIATVVFDAGAGQHRGGGRLLARTFGAAQPLGRRQGRQRAADAALR